MPTIETVDDVLRYAVRRAEGATASLCNEARALAARITKAEGTSEEALTVTSAAAYFSKYRVDEAAAAEVIARLGFDLRDVAEADLAQADKVTYLVDRAEQFLRAVFGYDGARSTGAGHNAAAEGECKGSRRCAEIVRTALEMIRDASPDVDLTGDLGGRVDAAISAGAILGLR